MKNSKDNNIPPRTFSPATWRLIIEEQPSVGAANMAVDQAIAEACGMGESPPTLRFYQWNPPTISLGRHQPIAEIDLDKVNEFGYHIVRRSTGGRAILHTDELTYSVAAPKGEPRVQGGVMDAYLRLSEALLAGLNCLSLEADKAPGHVRAGRDVSAACFEVPSAYEITFDGRKLMGSAQSRRSGYVLQHGTLPLVGDVTRLIDLLALPKEQANKLRTQLGERACSLSQALRVDPDDKQIQFETVAQALSQGFSEVLKLNLEVGQLSLWEMERSVELIEERYAAESWTNAM